MSSKELADIKEALKKIAELESRLKGFNLEDILKRLSKLDSEVEKLDKEKADKKDLDKLKDKLKDKIKKLKKRVSELESQLKALGSLSSDGSISADAVMKLS